MDLLVNLDELDHEFCALGHCKDGISVEQLHRIEQKLHNIIQFHCDSIRFGSIY